MIKNNSLGDRLNEFKNDQQNPETINQIGNITPITSLLNSFIALLIIFFKSFVFGLALKTLINADWKFLGFLCIGMSINFLIEYILDIIALFTNN